MLELETLSFRSELLQKIRTFFIERRYIELDTPAMSPALIPDTAHEVFKTVYIDPWTDENKSVFLSASHEYFLKKAVASTKASVFQMSKCYRNCEPAGRLISPEFTLLEVYTPEFSCSDTMALTESLFSSLKKTADNFLGKTDTAAGDMTTRLPFVRLSTDEVFSQYAGFVLSENSAPKQLAGMARKLGIPEFSDNPFDKWSSEELYELFMLQCIEPALPKNTGIFITDIPAFVPCLAKHKDRSGRKESFWKDCWTLYVGGTKIAISRNEETDLRTAKVFLEKEGKRKSASARVPCSLDEDFYKTYEALGECTSIELDVDRLIMLLAGKNSIESVIPFSFRLKTGYY